MKPKVLLGGMALLFVVVNVAGFLAYRQLRAPPAVPVATTKAAPQPSAEDVEREQNARARRAAGVAALEAGNYEKALINLTEARTLLGDAAKVDDLIKITEDLRLRSQQKTESDAAAAAAVAANAAAAKAADEAAAAAAAAARPRTPTSRPSPPRPVQVAAVERPPEPKPETKPTDAPAQFGAGNGMLLVSTTPRGLLVQVDGQPIDLTPMRIPVKAGTHTVALFDGAKRLSEFQVAVIESQVATVLRDLTAEVAPKAAEPKPAAAAPAPVATATPTPVAAPVVAKPEPTPTPAPTPVAANATTGGLELTSPGLYGEIWVDGRPFGFPPVTVQGLKPGPIKVEVRVNGAVKRSAMPVVEAGQVKAVRVR